MEEGGEGSGDLGVAPLEEGLITLSTLPKSHWSNLLNMDIIKVCTHYTFSNTSRAGSHRERCPHFRGCYVQASMELGPEDVSLLGGVLISEGVM